MSAAIFKSSGAMMVFLNVKLTSILSCSKTRKFKRARVYVCTAVCDNNLPQRYIWDHTILFPANRGDEFVLASAKAGTQFSTLHGRKAGGVNLSVLA